MDNKQKNAVIVWLICTFTFAFAWAFIFQSDETAIPIRAGFFAAYVGVSFFSCMITYDMSDK